MDNRAVSCKWGTLLKIILRHKNMKNLYKYILMALVVIGITLGVSQVFALNYSYVNPFGMTELASPVTGVTQAWDIVFNIVRWVYTIFFIVAVLFILLAAYNFVQGGANPEKVKAAKSQLRYAVIAIVVALVASGLSWIIAQFLGSGGLY